MKIIVYSISVLTFLLSSCTKEGSVGPAGPPGNANVHSVTFAISPNQWYHVGNQGFAGDGFEYVVAAPNITVDIVNTGSVISYISFDNATWYALPYTVPSFSGHAYSESWLTSYSVNQFIVDVADDDFLTQPPSSTIFLKIVAIAGSGRIRNPNGNGDNFGDAKNEFNLND